jgi:hypothetical protein
MDGLFATMRRLHERGPRSRGLVVDAEGVALGPACVLVRRTPAGYRRADVGQIADLTRSVFGHDARLDRIPIVLARITDALSAGDLVRAQLLALEIPLRDLDDAQLRRLRACSDLLKEGFDPNQLRDAFGRWTNEGSSWAETEATNLGPRAGLLASEALPWVVRALRVLSAPVAFFGTLLVPTNRSNVSEGTIPYSPGLAYRNDEGILTLYHVDDDGRRTVIFNGRPDVDQLYRDEQGNIVGRNIANGQGFVIDPEALPKLAEKIGAVENPKDRAQLQAYVDAVMKSDPRLCPLPSRDPGSPSEQAGLYQSQVCGLPPGWGVLFNKVRYDGCDPPTGILKECKALGFADKKIGEPSDDWPWPNWFTKDPKKGMTDIVNQMGEQSIAAGPRIVEWHVAEKPFADWLEFYAKTQGYENIRVYWTPPSAEVEELHRKALEAVGPLGLGRLQR